MTSQLVIFRAFLFIFLVPPTLDLKKIPVNQLIKKIWPYHFGHEPIQAYVSQSIWTVSPVTLLFGYAKYGSRLNIYPHSFQPFVYWKTLKGYFGKQ